MDCSAHNVDMLVGKLGNLRKNPVRYTESPDSNAGLVDNQQHPEIKFGRRKKPALGKK